MYSVEKKEQIKNLIHQLLVLSNVVLGLLEEPVKCLVWDGWGVSCPEVGGLFSDMNTRVGYNDLSTVNEN